jgi:hypothetical protein
MLLAMVEAGRTVLLRRIKSPDGRTRDPIPAARWVLAPWPTWLMWRRMVLWPTASFQDALAAEQERRHAIALLKADYGRRWKRHAPPELVWMLRSGVSMGDAVAGARMLAVRADTDGGGHAPDGGEAATWDADMSVSTHTAANGHAPRSNGRPVRTRRKLRSAPATDGPGVRGPATVQAGRSDSLARAAELLAHRPGMTGADLGRELGVSPRHGLRLKRQAEQRRPGDVPATASWNRRWWPCFAPVRADGVAGTFGRGAGRGAWRTGGV